VNHFRVVQPLYILDKKPTISNKNNIPSPTEKKNTYPTKDRSLVFNWKHAKQRIMTSIWKGKTNWRNLGSNPRPPSIEVCVKNCESNAMWSIALLSKIHGFVKAELEEELWAGRPAELTNVCHFYRLSE